VRKVRMTIDSAVSRQRVAVEPDCVVFA